MTMFAAIFAALKPLLPKLIEVLVTLATSKKALVSAATVVGVVHATDWKTQLITGAVGIGYTLAQAHVDNGAAKSTAP